MIDIVVRYLHDAGVPFRLTSFPKPEPLPEVAVALAPDAVRVATRLVLVGGAPAIACIPRGLEVNLAGLSNFTGAAVELTSPAELEGDLRGLPEPVPPLGAMLGVPLFLDETLTQARVVAFEAFSDGDVLQLAYDDLALIERPRVLALAIGGELPAAPLHS